MPKDRVMRVSLHVGLRVEVMHELDRRADLCGMTRTAFLEDLILCGKIQPVDATYRGVAPSPERVLSVMGGTMVARDGGENEPKSWEINETYARLNPSLCPVLARSGRVRVCGYQLRNGACALHGEIRIPNETVAQGSVKSEPDGLRAALIERKRLYPDAPDEIAISEPRGYRHECKWSAEDKAFVVTYPAFPGLSAFGKTEKQALEEGRVALGLFIKSYEEDGIPLPDCDASRATVETEEHETWCKSEREPQGVCNCWQDPEQQAKRERKEAAGWKYGDAAEFLGETPQESAIIERRVKKADRKEKLAAKPSARIDQLSSKVSAAVGAKRVTDPSSPHFDMPTQVTWPNGATTTLDATGPDLASGKGKASVEQVAFPKPTRKK